MANDFPEDEQSRRKPVFTTNTLPPDKRFDAFEAEVLHSAFGLVGDVSRENRSDFFAELFVSPVADVIVAEERSSAYDVSRVAADIARAPSRMIILYQQARGEIGFDLGDSESFVARNGFFHTGSADEAFRGIDLTQAPRHMRMLAIPLSRFGGHENDPRLLSAAPLLPGPGVSSLLASYASAFIDEAPHLAGAAAETAIDTLVRLIILARVGDQRQEPRAVHAIGNARLRRIFEIIEQEYLTPALSPAFVAATLNMSERQVHLLFEPTGQSFSRTVLARRLKEAARLLVLDPTRPISDIAFACGFESLRTFYRAFQAAHGMSAGDYRAVKIARPLGREPR